MHRPSSHSKDTQRTLIVGLGNPGRKYARHRHNVGFMTVSRLAKRHGLAFKRQKGKAKVAEGTVAGQRVILVKPQTFMNLSGESVARLVRFFKIPPQRVLVVYDDLDLPLARLRLRPGGGSGGHKGLKSVIERLGTQDFPRLRLGIGRPLHGDPIDYVLQDFSTEERIEFERVLDRAVEAIEYWLIHGIDASMNVFNQPSLNRDEPETRPEEQT
jgi:PTH1 family peptidyl-tRNA hydrolase